MGNLQTWEVRNDFENQEELDKADLNAEKASEYIKEATTTNPRPKIKLEPEEEYRQINSFRGSFGLYHVQATTKSRFAFSAQQKYPNDLILRSRKGKKLFIFTITNNSIKIPSGGGRYYFSKSKLGLETMCYNHQEQLNCFFSNITFKKLLAAPSTKTYAIEGVVYETETLDLGDFQARIGMLMGRKVRFELKHIRHQESKSVILTYRMPEYHCCKLLGTDLAGDRPTEITQAVNSAWFGYIHFLVFLNTKVIVAYNKECREEILITGYKVTDEGSLETILVGSIAIPTELVKGSFRPGINERLSHDAELIVVEFPDVTRFYDFTPEGGLEMVYEYAKKRLYNPNLINPMNERIRVLRSTGDVITICEDYKKEGVLGEEGLHITDRQSFSSLEKFNL